MVQGVPRGLYLPCLGGGNAERHVPLPRPTIPCPPMAAPMKQGKPGRLC